MRSDFNRASRAYAGALAVALVGWAFSAPPTLAWPVGDAGDVTLENFTAKAKDGGVVSVARIDFANTNLSKDEITALLTPDTPEADERALVEKFKADKISAPAIEIVGKDGMKLTVHDFLATDVEGGRVGKLGFSGIVSSGTSGEGSAASLKSGALLVEGLDMADMLKAISGPANGAKRGRMDHLSWNAIDIVTSAGAPAKTTHIALGSIDVRAGYSGDALKECSTKLTGVVIEPSPDFDEGKSLASLGYSKVELAVGASAKYAADAKALSLDSLTIDGAQMGSLTLKANFTDVAPEALAGGGDSFVRALQDGGIASLELRIVNSGLFEKALALSAQQAGATPQALAQQWSAVIGQMAPLFLGGSPSALNAAQEAQKFIASPHNLAVTIKAKQGALKAADFMAISDPTALVGKLDISAAANK